MRREILQNEATAAKRRVYFHLVDGTDGISAEISEAGSQPQISVDGAAWTNTGIGTLTHIGNGRYYAELTQAILGTHGEVIETRYKSAATAESPGDTVEVVPGTFEQAAIWVDLDNGNDSNAGGRDNPVLTLSQALTNAAAETLYRIILTSDGNGLKTATADASCVGLEIIGQGDGFQIKLDPNGQLFTDAVIRNLRVAGTFDSTGSAFRLFDCFIGDCVNLYVEAHRCELSYSAAETQILGPCSFVDCWGRKVASPQITWDNAAIPSTTPSAYFTNYNGPITIDDLADADYDYCTLGGGGEGFQLTIGAGCTSTGSGLILEGNGRIAANNGTITPADNRINTTATGSSQMTVTVQDSGASAIPGVNVAVYDSGNSTLHTSGVTNGSGQVVFSLQDGTYKARCAAAGYGFTVPETLTVSGTSTATITATAAAALADATTYEQANLRRFKCKYNDDNATNKIEHILVRDGAKITPASATITIYKPGSTTAVLAATAMTVSGSVCSYAIDTTTVADFPIDEGYRAEIAITSGGVVYDDVVMFDVTKFPLNLPISIDQLVQLDDGIRGMVHDGDQDFSELIEACRDIMQTKIEAHVVDAGQLLETMIIDTSKIAVAARFYILRQIYLSKGDFEKAEKYEEEFGGLFKAVLQSIRYDTDQDGQEEAAASGVHSTRLKT